MSRPNNAYRYFVHEIQEDDLFKIKVATLFGRVGDELVYILTLPFYLIKTAKVGDEVFFESIVTERSDHEKKLAQKRKRDEKRQNSIG